MAISNDNTRIQITLPKDVKKQLEKKASENNRSVSNYVVTLILKDLENQQRNSMPKEYPPA